MLGLALRKSNTGSPLLTAIPEPEILLTVVLKQVTRWPDYFMTVYMMVVNWITWSVSEPQAGNDF